MLTLEVFSGIYIIDIKESDFMLELEENSTLLQELQKTLQELGESL